MPRIINEKVNEILRDPYFVQHTAMHLAREALIRPGKRKLALLLPPCVCEDCRRKKKNGAEANPGMAGAAKPAMAGMSMGGADTVTGAAKPAMPGMSMGGADTVTGAAKPNEMHSMAGMGGPHKMKEVGEPGSGRQLLEMHHEMIQVFRFLLADSNPPLRFLADWPSDPNEPERKWSRTADPDGAYAPELWDLDDPYKLPHEIVGMLKVTDPKYLGLVFDGVKRLVEPNHKKVDEAVDDLGRFIEQGVKSGDPDGSGFHDTMHEFLAAREGRSAQGAEMNKLTNSRFNDYFWSLHLWIDGQYGRLLEKRGLPFDTKALDPKTLDICTAKAADKTMPEMSLATP